MSLTEEDEAAGTRRSFVTVEDLEVGDDEVVCAGRGRQPGQAIGDVEIVVIEKGHDVALGGGQAQIAGGGLGGRSCSSMILRRRRGPATASILPFIPSSGVALSMTMTSTS